MRRTFALALTLLAPASQGTELPSGPILRVETGVHSGIIQSIATDAAHRFIVTASSDKTIRIWAPTTGELIRVLRPPIGPGEEGELYAAAVSPDGQIIAAGGRTAGGAQSIYIFSSSTGDLLRRLHNLPDTVSSLAFSRDGMRIAAAFQFGGIKVFRAADGLEIGHDADYRGFIYGISFDRSGRLVTSCLDGTIRLYDSELRKIAQEHVGGKPLGIQFSPDGQKVAVGYEGVPKVEILSGSSLKRVSNPNMTGITEESALVAWSIDGNFLYSSLGSLNIGSFPKIRRWTQGGRGRYRDLFPGAKRFISDIAPLTEGRLAFATIDSEWGILNPNGKRSPFRVAQTVDFQGTELKIDPTGKSAGFHYANTSIPAIVSSETVRSSSGDSQLISPRLQVLGLDIRGWELNMRPLLNGQPLTLDPMEISLSLAVARDAQVFLLGTSTYLRLHEATGRGIWKFPAPGPVWAVNLSEDGRLAVAAFGDGTIRWFLASDGRELLAFFPHPDQKRWIMWTPSGFYSASARGEELIGWHLNRGLDKAADWFPASRFSGRFFRPDVVARVLETGDESRALAEANAEAQKNLRARVHNQLQPPTVIPLIGEGEIETREPNLTLRIAVDSPSGEPITTIRSYVDGRPVSTSRGLIVESNKTTTAHEAKEVFDISIPIPPKDCTVVIIAETRFATSEPVALKVRWIATPPIPKRPNLYLLAVGVSTYENPRLQLELPAKDARDMADAWKRQEEGLYGKVEIRLLTDKVATRDAILSGLEWLETQVTQTDVAVLFFAGHGVNDPRSGGYQFLPYEADLNARRTTLLPDREVISTLAGLPGKALVFLDTCYSGNLLGGLKTRDAGDVTRLINELASVDNGVVVFAASTGRQLSAESPEWKNGAFTKAVVEALDGKADLDGNRSIWITEIESYVSKRLKELTGGLQTPVYHKPGGVPDFPVAVAPRP